MEQKGPPERLTEELTDEQREMAELYIDQCGLADVADRQITLQVAEGVTVTGTVHDGLARCWHHLTDMTPDAIAAYVRAGLDAPVTE